MRFKERNLSENVIKVKTLCGNIEQSPGRITEKLNGRSFKER